MLVSEVFAARGSLRRSEHASHFLELDVLFWRLMLLRNIILLIQPEKSTAKWHQHNVSVQV